MWYLTVAGYIKIGLNFQTDFWRRSRDLRALSLPLADTPVANETPTGNFYCHAIRSVQIPF
jgi:hypothetical protein